MHNITNPHHQVIPK